MNYVTRFSLHVCRCIIHSDAEAIDVIILERVDIKQMHEALAVAFTDCLPPRDCTDVVERRIVTPEESTDDPSLAAFGKVVVARTLSTWKVSDGSVAAQTANPSSVGVALYLSLIHI